MCIRDRFMTATELRLDYELASPHLIAVILAPNAEDPLRNKLRIAYVEAGNKRLIIEDLDSQSVREQKIVKFSVTALDRPSPNTPSDIEFSAIHTIAEFIPNDRFAYFYNSKEKIVKKQDMLDSIRRRWLAEKPKFEKAASRSFVLNNGRVLFVAESKEANKTLIIDFDYDKTRVCRLVCCLFDGVHGVVDDQRIECRSIENVKGHACFVFATKQEWLIMVSDGSVFREKPIEGYQAGDDVFYKNLMINEDGALAKYFLYPKEKTAAAASEQCIRPPYRSMEINLYLSICNETHKMSLRIQRNI
eukprot:TRINITY_DN8989_c0_g1_i2.p1 TRINITY_DN8989_c0_g1~~TRINITY_DN8989_c0_g1_i2.p1  ORF type:complete len:333 (+),score=91.05 TRINITY_DN8989_c0_g1_i2:89-1000(+)